jgi:hypothetical protein
MPMPATTSPRGGHRTKKRRTSAAAAASSSNIDIICHETLSDGDGNSDSDSDLILGLTRPLIAPPPAGGAGADGGRAHSTDGAVAAFRAAGRVWQPPGDDSAAEDTLARYVLGAVYEQGVTPDAPSVALALWGRFRVQRVVATHNPSGELLQERHRRLLNLRLCVAAAATVALVAKLHAEGDEDADAYASASAWSPYADVGMPVSGVNRERAEFDVMCAAGWCVPASSASAVVLSALMDTAAEASLRQRHAALFLLNHALCNAQLRAHTGEGVLVAACAALGLVWGLSTSVADAAAPRNHFAVALGVDDATHADTVRRVHAHAADAIARDTLGLREPSIRTRHPHIYTSVVPIPY